MENGRSDMVGYLSTYYIGHLAYWALFASYIFCATANISTHFHLSSDDGVCNDSNSTKAVEKMVAEIGILQSYYLLY